MTRGRRMKIQIIIGSTRPGRVGPQIAQWVQKNVSEENDIKTEIVDIVNWNLPIFDEPVHPSMNQYQNDHTKSWSEKIKQADGYIFLTPEYNAGYPASLKNAIDYLYHEWTNKPVMVVSYGARGGTSASAQLKQVAERLKMRPTETSPAFTVTRDMSSKDGQIIDINASFEQYKAALQLGAKELITLVNSVPIGAA
jgi:NAD(P)H-dependent FMN reductase